MKELRRNMRLVGALIICLFTFLCAGYALTVYTQGAQWASTAYNTRGNASGSHIGYWAHHRYHRRNSGGDNSP